MSEETIRGHGVIVTECFDEGCLRRLPWCERPGAAGLLAEARRPDRKFDAVVVGEYERVFYRDQFTAVLTMSSERGSRR
ncbi:hypothetical protein QRX50_36930 [Amycolatopsis carbonis]|uniref:Uncharacterized protein n=1 Tax=Amycolatopsis carbonis TaxID=715471 RepID=A0A9Y2IBP5_9PSEU|nr:hypothetical protein [Amycolatopsis sp. 2-15]WIX76964.1 hypothetical protein QRX50_36930 [Amycolatopsis sp. 2-15]